MRDRREPAGRLPNDFAGRAAGHEPMT
ncbi:DNA-binding protein, partial [Burkholderia multivorans]